MKITRRDFVKTGVLASAAGAALCNAPRAEDDKTAVPPDKPNILLIHVDQHRADCLGAYGNTDIRTPHIDALAKDGVRFDNSFCPYPVCTPSRYSLLSGLYAHEHRGSSNRSTLAPDIATFPRLLRNGGYKTKAIGKMHFTPTYLDTGFDEMLLSEQDGEGRWDDDYHRALMREGLADLNDLEDQRNEYRRRARPEYWENFGAMPSNLPESWHSTSWIGDRVADTVEGWDNGGNLLMAGFVKPHHPFDPPRSWLDAYNPDALTLLPGWTPDCFEHDIRLHRGYFPHEQLTEKVLRRVMAAYYATIEQIDAQVGRMMEILRRKGLYENTMVIYTSDHGEFLGFHHLLLKGNYPYDPLVKVPLIIKYPKQRLTPVSMPQGASKALVNNLDVAPTILGQAGIAPCDAMRGKDLAVFPAGRDIIFCESGRKLAMARTNNRKIIMTRQGKPDLFFDLEKDPLEMENRAGDPAYGDEINRLARAIDEWGVFKALQEPWLDENAPVIAQPNVPQRTQESRTEIIAYYQACWEKGISAAPG